MTGDLKLDQFGVITIFARQVTVTSSNTAFGYSGVTAFGYSGVTASFFTMQKTCENIASGRYLN